MFYFIIKHPFLCFSLLVLGNIPSYEVTDSLLVHVDGVHRISMKWSYMQYLITAQIYYGTRPVGQPVLSEPVSVVNKSSQRIVFDSWFVIKV